MDNFQSFFHLAWFPSNEHPRFSFRFKSQNTDLGIIETLHDYPSHDATQDFLIQLSLVLYQPVKLSG